DKGVHFSADCGRGLGVAFPQAGPDPAIGQRAGRAWLGEIESIRGRPALADIGCTLRIGKRRLDIATAECLLRASRADPIGVGASVVSDAQRRAPGRAGSGTSVGGVTCTATRR